MLSTHCLSEVSMKNLLRSFDESRTARLLRNELNQATVGEETETMCGEALISVRTLRFTARKLLFHFQSGMRVDIPAALTPLASPNRFNNFVFQSHSPPRIKAERMSKWKQLFLLFHSLPNLFVVFRWNIPGSVDSDLCLFWLPSR